MNLQPLHLSPKLDLSATLPCLASFDHSSFNDQTELNSKSSCILNGQLICMNILQEFKDYNHKEYLEKHGASIWDSIYDGSALADPEEYLSKFAVIVYADLKKYKFYYWFAFPVINYPLDVNIVKSTSSKDSDSHHKPISDIFNDESLQTIQEEYDKPRSQRKFQKGYFIVKHSKNLTTASETVEIFPLTQYKTAVQDQDMGEESTIYFAYTEPSGIQMYPGWPLRNFLCLIAVQFQLDHLKIIRLRKGPTKNNSRLEIHHSMVFEVYYQLNPQYSVSQIETIPQIPQVTGWEKNESQQMGPKKVDLSSLLDPRKLAEDAVNLNLRLMKWRLLPSLDLDKIAATKCLLLGCGTLGCHIARGLLAWGIKNIGILDYGKISYSNPVRQTLYNFDDCAKSTATFKAEAAAASLKRIHPSVNVSSYVLSIPMPGHPIASKEIEQTKSDVATLEKLIEEHDVIFLLMDTRESRWLPTVIAMSKQKLVINAAIGFDTFLLQRYGIRDYSRNVEEEVAMHSRCPKSEEDLPTESTSETKSTGVDNYLPSNQLGCYFCNDIVAPGDSTLDRTLDQQCTVSRPGVSMMVSAMAVELLASIISSKAGPLTPAPLEIRNDVEMNDEDCGSELGIVPHSIRGNLARYHIYMPTSPSFNKCSACSSSVIEAYRSKGFEFLQQVFEDPSYLEEVAGLKDLQNISDNVWAFESDDESDGLSILNASS